MITRRRMAGLLAVPLAAPALAQAAWTPDRTVTMVVAFAAGGGTDLAARTIARFMERDLGVSVVGQSRRVTSYSGGVNWWLTRNVRVSTGVVWEDYHDEIDFGSGHEEDSLLGWLSRFQIDF